MGEEKAALRPLSTRRPLDYLMLVWWVLAAPARLKAYRERFGKADERRLGRWLAPMLIWGTPLILTLALGLGRVPYAGRVFSPQTYLGLSAGLVLVGLLQGFLGERWSRGVVFAASLLPLAIALDLHFPFQADLALVGAFLTAAGVVSVLANVLAGGTTPLLPFAQGLILACGVFLEHSRPAPHSPVAAGLKELLVGVAVGGVAALIIAGGLGAGLDASVSMGLESGRPSRLGRAAVVILPAAYLFLIWFCLLDGWRLFA